jgi:hypothetical protein
MSPMSPRLLRPRARQAGALPPDPNANLRSGLIAFYPLSNDSDSSGNDRNLTATNITYQAGKIGNGAYFDGSAYFTTNSLPAFSGANMTIAGWFKNIGADYEDFLIGAGNADLSVYIVRVGGDIKASVSEGYSETFAGGSGANDGNWHFFAVTRTATQKKVWLDQTVNSVGGSYGALNNPTPFSIGSNWDNGYLLLDGMMDAVGIWDRALSDAEIAQLYNAGAGLEISATPPLSPSTSGWSGTGSEATKLARATLTGTNTNSNTITINSAGLLRITATTSGAGDGTGGLMTIVAGGQTYTGNSGGSGGSWSVDITKTVTVGQTITFASEYANGSFDILQAWIIPPAAPPAPTSLTSPSQSSGSVYLTWAAPANDGGSAITDYSVQYSANSGSTWTTFSRSASTALNATATGLTNGTSYQFRVAGVNSVGTGSYSSTTTATPTAGNSLTASGWSGAGTSASKLSPPASPATFTSSPSIAVGTSGTLNVSIVSDDNYNDGWEVIIRRNGTAVYQNDGNAANGTTFTVAVTAGQTITLAVSGGGARWFASTRLWVS